MARKKTTKKKSTRNKSDHSERNMRLFLGGSLFLGAIGVFAGASWGVSELDRKAANFVVEGNPQVEIRWPTTAQGEIWMPMNERDRVQELITRSVQGGNALSRAPLEEAGLALMRSNWIEGTPTVQWTSEGVIQVDAQWRVPAAVVRVGNREFIIDWNRIVLPLDYGIGESNQYFFENADAQLPRTGEVWMGTDLQDGLKLLEILGNHQLLEQVEGFDLGTQEQSGTIVIRTNRNASILWGAGPGRERPGELTTSEKLGRLQALYEDTGLIDGGFVMVDISGAEIFVERATD